jgi:hypothetical protein
VKRDAGDRRALRESPYIGDHVASRSARNTEPRGFAGLLAWFLAGFWAETPERVHVAGVWFGPPTASADIAAHDPATGDVISSATDLTGGSQLGAPRQAGPMRQLLENAPAQVYDHDTPDAHYARPMRAALHRLAGRDSDATFMARFLVQVAYAAGDWQSVAHRWFPAYPFVQRPFAEQALRRLFAQYRDEPPARLLPAPGWTDLSESQRTAIVAGEKGVA